MPNKLVSSAVAEEHLRKAFAYIASIARIQHEVPTCVSKQMARSEGLEPQLPDHHLMSIGLIHAWPRLSRARISFTAINEAMFSKYSLLGNTVESVHGEINIFMRSLHEANMRFVVSEATAHFN